MPRQPRRHRGEPGAFAVPGPDASDAQTAAVGLAAGASIQRVWHLFFSTGRQAVGGAPSNFFRPEKPHKTQPEKPHNTQYRDNTQNTAQEHTHNTAPRNHTNHTAPRKHKTRPRKPRATRSSAKTKCIAPIAPHTKHSTNHVGLLTYVLGAML